MGSRVSGLGFGCLRFRVSGVLAFWRSGVQVLGFQGSGLQGSGFRSLGFRSFDPTSAKTVKTLIGQIRSTQQLAKFVQRLAKIRIWPNSVWPNSATHQDWPNWD